MWNQQNQSMIQSIRAWKIRTRQSANKDVEVIQSHKVRWWEVGACTPVSPLMMLGYGPLLFFSFVSSPFFFLLSGRTTKEEKEKNCRRKERKTWQYDLCVLSWCFFLSFFLFSCSHSLPARSISLVSELTTLNWQLHIRDICLTWRILVRRENFSFCSNVAHLNSMTALFWNRLLFTVEKKPEGGRSTTGSKEKSHVKQSYLSMKAKRLKNWFDRQWLRSNIDLPRILSSEKEIFIHRFVECLSKTSIDIDCYESKKNDWFQESFLFSHLFVRRTSKRLLAIRWLIIVLCCPSKQSISLILVRSFSMTEQEKILSAFIQSLKIHFFPSNDEEKLDEDEFSDKIRKHRFQLVHQTCQTLKILDYLESKSILPRSIASRIVHVGFDSFFFSLRLNKKNRSP